MILRKKWLLIIAGILILISFVLINCEEDEGIGATGYLTYSIRGIEGASDFTTSKGFHIKINKAFMVAGAFQSFFGIEGESYNLLDSPYCDVYYHTGHPHTLEGCPTAGESRVCDIFAIDLLAEKNVLETEVPSRAGLYTAFIFFVVNYASDLIVVPEEVINGVSGDIPDELKDSQFVYLDFTVDDSPMQLCYSIELVTHVDEQNTELSLEDGDSKEIIYEIDLMRWFDNIEDYSDEEEVIDILRSRAYDWYSWDIIIPD